MVGVKITKRVSVTPKARVTAATMKAIRIIKKKGDYDTEARKREEILREFSQNPHSRETAIIAWIESFVKDLHLVKKNLKAVERALSFEMVHYTGASARAKMPKGRHVIERQ